MGVLADIATKTAGVQRTAPVDNLSWTPICDDNPQRFALGFAPTIGAACTISLLNSGGFTQGVQLATTGILWLTVKDHGVLAQQQWYGHSGGGVTNIIVFELIFPRGG